MYKLLLVDDEQIIREGLERMIDWEGLDLSLTASCPNAIAALDSMMDDMPDILVTDVRMPGMDGLELVERAMSLHPRLRAIILSGYDTFAYAQQAVRAGVMEYLLKPCAREELEQALVRACRAIDKERRHVLHLNGERQARVKTLVEKLGELRESALDIAQMERQVCEIAKTAEDPSLLREALVSIVTSSLGGGQAEWKLNVIMGAFSQQESLERLIASSLYRLRGESGGARGFVRQMTDYVKAHCADEALSLQYMADNVVYMNADYIGREFTRAMGRKFSAYLLEVRMERAKMLMATDGALHSYEIAERVGLGNNPHYFSQVFRKYTGMTPKEYRVSLEEARRK